MKKHLSKKDRKYMLDILKKEGIKIEFEEDGKNLMAILKIPKHIFCIKIGFKKYYVCYLGIIRGQGHHPLWFKSKKAPFLINYDKKSKHTRLVKDELLKYISMGGRIVCNMSPINDFVTIIYFDLLFNYSFCATIAFY